MADRILIVEGERIAEAGLRETLVGLGYEVTGVVSTGAEAILEAERNRPDVVLMGHEIRGRIGPTAAAAILRDHFGVPTVSMVVLAGPSGAGETGFRILEESALKANIETALASRPALHGATPLSGIPGEGPLSIARAERDLIVRALRECGDNQTRAAIELGVTRDILRHRMKKYGLLPRKTHTDAATGKP